MLCEENPINTCSAQRTKTIEGSGLFVVLVQGVRTESQSVPTNMGIYESDIESSGLGICRNLL